MLSCPEDASLSGPMDIRDRILDAAKRVYAAHGFRGATTRLIANEAGVNEVTLFRTFGSKSCIFQELMRSVSRDAPLPQLPDIPADPERELTGWCDGTLGFMRANRSILRNAIAEIEERPDAAAAACEGPSCAAAELAQYLGRLSERGLLSEPLDEAEVHTAVSMLMSALWGDAMCREVIPEAFPPETEAASRYVHTFVRAIGARPAAVAPSRVPAAAPRARRSAP